MDLNTCHSNLFNLFKGCTGSAKIRRTHVLVYSYLTNERNYLNFIPMLCYNLYQPPDTPNPQLLTPWPPKNSPIRSVSKYQKHDFHSILTLKKCFYLRKCEKKYNVTLSSFDNVANIITMPKSDLSAFYTNNLDEKHAKTDKIPVENVFLGFQYDVGKHF